MTFLEKSLDNLPDDVSEGALLSDTELDNVAGGANSSDADNMWCPGCNKYIPTSKVVNHVCQLCGHTFGASETY